MRSRQFLSRYLSNPDLDHQRVGGRRDEPLRVYYQDPCHLKYHLNITSEPRALIRSKKGVVLVNPAPDGPCCGNGGFFHLVHPRESRDLMIRFKEAVQRSGANTLVTSCTGCLMQAQKAAGQGTGNLKILHLAQLLALVEQT